MNIAIIGYGSMGKMIELDAKTRGLTVKSIIDPKAQGAMFKEINEESMKDVDVAIDFTHPSIVVENIKKCCDLGVNLVVGTTGWYDRVPEVREIVEKTDIKFLWASNFSVGVNIYFRVLDAASQLINCAEDYDVWANEIHHFNKVDSPSGTAKSISDIMLKNIDRKQNVVYDMVNRRIEKDEFHFASVRGGPVNFEHTVGFDSAADCITVKHAARNRSGYASGVVIAARWLHGKEKGFYELDDWMKGILPFKITMDK
jgi:4-hydroxy-tetrahydrodipicolinate reductase